MKGWPTFWTLREEGVFHGAHTDVYSYLRNIERDGRIITGSAKIAAILNISARNCRRILSDLEGHGFILQRGSKPGIKRHVIEIATSPGRRGVPKKKDKQKQEAAARGRTQEKGQTKPAKVGQEVGQKKQSFLAQDLRNSPESKESKKTILSNDSILLTENTHIGEAPLSGGGGSPIKENSDPKTETKNPQTEKPEPLFKHIWGPWQERQDRRAARLGRPKYKG